MASTETTTPSIVVTSTAHGIRLHLPACKNAASARPVAIADLTTGIAASCCKPKSSHVDAARQALGIFADPDTLPELLAAHVNPASTTPEPNREAIASATTTSGPLTDDMRLVAILANLGGCDVTRAEMSMEFPQRVWVAAEANRWISITRDDDGDTAEDRYTVTDAGYVAIGHADAPAPAKAKRRKKTTPTTSDTATDAIAGETPMLAETTETVSSGDSRWHDDEGSDVREYPGVIRFRHTRTTGALVVTVRVAEHGRDDLKIEDGKYAALCLTHGGIKRMDVRRAANYSLPDSHQWCDGCARHIA